METILGALPKPLIFSGFGKAISQPPEQMATKKLVSFLLPFPLSAEKESKKESELNISFFNI